MSTSARAKLAEDDSSDHAGTSGSSDGENASHLDQESSQNTDDTGGQRMKSRQTLKRKRRATEPSQFGETLQSLLSTRVPSGLPLSLKQSAARKKNEGKVEFEAKKVIQIERKEREERGRVRDVIGGWGGESERSLRKVAQRGVVKLFNTIQQSQLAAAAAEEEAKASRGTGKPSLPTPSLGKKDRGTKKSRGCDNSRSEKHSAANKDIFFDMIRSGGVVSKV